jgi:hypothetical protein
MYGSDPFSYDFEASLALAGEHSSGEPVWLNQAERQARWGAGLSLDGSRLDPVVARYLARRGARPDMPGKPDIRLESNSEDSEDVVRIHEIEHQETHTTIPTLPVSVRQLERHRLRYGREFIELVKISDEGSDKRERPLPPDWKQRRSRCLQRDKKTCQRCNRALGARLLSVHHIQPRADGGSGDLSTSSRCAPSAAKRTADSAVTIGSKFRSAEDGFRQTLRRSRVLGQTRAELRNPAWGKAWRCRLHEQLCQVRLPGRSRLLDALAGQ